MPKRDFSKNIARNSQVQAQYADSFHLRKPNQAPQAPNMTMKTNAQNQYRGHGRGQ